MLTADMLLTDESGYIESIGLGGAERSRLMDMGLVPGTLLKMKAVSPFGDPLLVSVHHTDLSLRKDQARLIVLRGEV